MKTLIFKTTFTFVLCLSMLCSTAWAHTHEAISDEIDYPITSPWAAVEIDRAQELGLPQSYRGSLSLNYQAASSRHDFVSLLLRYLSIQQDNDEFAFMAETYLCEENSSGPFVQEFSDASSEENLAYKLGLVSGRGDGRFDPDAAVTRQEAAVMLARAYRFIGGTLPEHPASLAPFLDEAKIADWAREGVDAMAALSVMGGFEDGSFRPEDSYTLEQCIISFLRLCERAPTSRQNGNVKPLFTREQALAMMPRLAGGASEQNIALRLDGPKASFFQSNRGAVMSFYTDLSLVYPDGRIKEIDTGLCTKYNRPFMFHPKSNEIQNVRFSDDGATIFIDVLLPEDVFYTASTPDYPNDGKLLHARGLYHLRIDVESRQLQSVREALP